MPKAMKVVPKCHGGFTLTEIAVVLIIVALLIGGMLMPLSAQDELRRTAETQKTINDIREALLGFVIINDRLPCPASATSHGLEEWSAGGNCNTVTWPNNANTGFVPAATLGITPTDSAGFAIDAWGNRIRYAVTVSQPGSPFVNGIGSYYRNNGNVFPSSDLHVCASAPDAASLAASLCATPDTTNVLANHAVAVIFSVGKNGGDRGGIDETINLGAKPLFISHTPTPAGSADGEFDDILTWISPNIVFGRLVAAGRLP